MNKREAMQGLHDDATRAAPAIVRVLDTAKFIAPQFVNDEMSELDAVAEAYSRLTRERQ